MAKSDKPLKLVVKSRYAERFRKGWPVLSAEVLVNPVLSGPEGRILRLYDEKNRFLAVGYYGLQNKGIGWILDTEESTVIDEDFFRKRFVKALGHRSEFFESDETTAFRVFNGDGDGIGGLTIDFYDGYYLFTYYSQGIYHFKDQILKAFSQVTGYIGLYQKKRFDTSGKYIGEDDFVAGSKAPEPLIIKESGVCFATYLNDGAMTGVFLDQRNVRRTLRDHYSAGKTVLNTFSYTGAFSVFCALGGATKTTSVDLANRSLAKTKEQFSVNHLASDSQEIIVDDVFKFFKYAGKKSMKYDIVILDPPSYATSKDYTFSAERNYTELLKEAIAITAEKGLLVASTNCSAFGMEKFKSFVKTAFFDCGKDYEILEEHGLPSDFRVTVGFPESSYLKVLFLRVVD